MLFDARIRVGPELTTCSDGVDAIDGESLKTRGSSNTSRKIKIAKGSIRSGSGRTYVEIGQILSRIPPDSDFGVDSDTTCEVSAEVCYQCIVETFNQSTTKTRITSF
jgi:hypothetical protein